MSCSITFAILEASTDSPMVNKIASMILSIFLISNEVIMYSQFDGMIYKFNLTNDTFTQYEAKLSRADDKKVKSHIDSMFARRIHIESQELSLTDYLDAVNWFNNKELQPQEQKNYGKSIYKAINSID